MTPPLLPTAETETVEQLGEAIADIAAGIHAATYQLLVLLHQFDDRGGWNGFLSCAHWLGWRTGIDMGAAREKVRVARALTRIATPENEERLLAIAHCGSAAQVERLVRAWRWCDRREENLKHLSRSVKCHTDDDGMVILRARLTPEQGAVVQRALEAASDRLHQEHRQAAPPDRIDDEVTSEQRQADALVLVAECLERGPGSGVGWRPLPGRDAHRVVESSDRRSHHIVAVHDGGVGVSAETSRRLSCDASVVIMREDADGNPLGVGRTTRTIPTRIRRALAARDNGCTFPGCTSRRCDAHHVVHWIDGGRTSLENLVLLCRRHHTLVHEGGVSVERTEEGDVNFRRPDGRLIEVVPRMTWSGGQFVPEGVSGRSLRTWDGTPLNVGAAIDVLHPRANPSSVAGRQ